MKSEQRRIDGDIKFNTCSETDLQSSEINFKFEFNYVLLLWSSFELSLQHLCAENSSSCLSGVAAVILQKAEIRIINSTVCKNLLEDVTDNMLCAGVLKGGVDACQVQTNHSDTVSQSVISSYYIQSI